MIWGKYISLFGLSTFKFMFAPLAGIPLGLNFFETYFSCIAGAIVTSAFAFFLSEWLILRSQKRRLKKIKEAIAKGKKIPQKKKFTFTNKLIVKIKRTFGIYGICMFVPLFLSIPLGTIVSAKFYGKNKKAFPLILLGIMINGFVITSVVYLIGN